MEKELQKRKPVRLQNFDYNSAGTYFITICTQNRQQVLSRIVGGDVLDAPNHVELLPYGKIADKYIKQLNDFYTYVNVTNYVIMPDHIHLMLFVHENGASRTSPPTKQHSVVSRFVSTFKRFCNKEYGVNIWQRHFWTTSSATKKIMTNTCHTSMKTQCGGIMKIWINKNLKKGYDHEKKAADCYCRLALMCYSR